MRDFLYMRNKVLVSCSILFSLLLALRLFGVIAFYNIPTSGSEPNIKQGAYVIGSNIINPNRLDFCYYKRKDSLFGDMIVMQRLVGLPGDVIESKNGVLFVNGNNIDEKLNLKRLYKSKKVDVEKLDAEFVFNAPIRKYMDKDSVSFYVNDIDLKNIPAVYTIYENTSTEYFSKDLYLKRGNSNFDNFGPIKIPKKKHFFVGDNRDNSLDSRSFGFIDELNIKGKVIVIIN